MSATTTVGKLTKKILITGKITAKTGLHIGGNSAGMSIGSADATVVRNPITRQPYIPGSSLKGKMRSLLERVEGKFGLPQGKDIQYSPYRNLSDSDIPKIFGVTPEDLKNQRLPAQPVARLIVRDAALEKKSADKLFTSKDTDMPYTEVKTEVVIDRITSAATPRQLERVPAGAVFEMSMILNVFEGDNEKEFLNKIFEGLILVQNDYLGGKGTRGSGEVKIEIEKVKKKDKDDYEKNNSWQDYTEASIPEELKPISEDKK